MGLRRDVRHCDALISDLINLIWLDAVNLSLSDGANGSPSRTTLYPSTLHTSPR